MRKMKLLMALLLSYETTINAFVPLPLRSPQVLKPHSGKHHRNLLRPVDSVPLDELGQPSDDALYKWSCYEENLLREKGIKVFAGKLVDPYENSLFTITLQFPDHIEDRVVHIYQQRGQTTRYYSILGKNSNGINLKEFEKFRTTCLAKSIAVACLEFGILALLFSGEFSEMVHELNADGTNKEVIATTGILSLLSSKAIEWIAGHGTQGLNPWYHYHSYDLLSLPKEPCQQVQYTKEAIPDVLIDRLDEPYNGYLKQGGLNPELRICFKVRAKSDQDWLRELKLVSRAISKKRFNLMVGPSENYCEDSESECYIEFNEEEAKQDHIANHININVENFVFQQKDGQEARKYTYNQPIKANKGTPALSADMILELLQETFTAETLEDMLASSDPQLVTDAVMIRKVIAMLRNEISHE